MSTRKQNHYDVFISYRRDGGIEAAMHLADVLEARGYKVFIDKKSLMQGHFPDNLEKAIDASKDVVVIESPGAFDRCINDDDWVRMEILQAHNSGKNIIPLQTEGFLMPASLPDDIAFIKQLQTIQLNSDYYLGSIEKLESFMVSKKRWPLVARLILAVLVCICILLVTMHGVQYFQMYPRNNSQRETVNSVIDTVNLVLECYSTTDDYYNEGVELAAYYLTYSGNKGLVVDRLNECLSGIKNQIVTLDKTEYPEDIISHSEFDQDKYNAFLDGVRRTQEERYEILLSVLKNIEDLPDILEAEAWGEESADAEIQHAEQEISSEEKKEILKENIKAGEDSLRNVLTQDQSNSLLVEDSENTIHNPFINLSDGGEGAATDGLLTEIENMDIKSSLSTFDDRHTSIEKALSEIQKQIPYENDAQFYLINNFLMPVTDRELLSSYAENNVYKLATKFSDKTAFTYEQNDLEQKMEITQELLDYNRDSILSFVRKTQSEYVESGE